MHFKHLSFLVIITISLFACIDKKTRVPVVKEVKVISDTLNVGYTYWQANDGPFLGLCGDKYTFAFLGTVAHIDPPIADSISHYKSQKGTIKISEILKANMLAEKAYKGQPYFSSDCFYDAAVKPGDMVLVFCYEYENAISIPGKRAILKIDGLQDPALASIKKYIALGEDPVTLQDDVALWEEKGFGPALERIMACRTQMTTQEKL